MRKGIPLIVFLYLLVLNTTADDFIVTWRDCEHGLTNHSCLVDIKNLNPLARNFDLSLFFSDTSYQIERTSATIHEWKGIDTKFPTYDTQIIEKICYLYDNQTEVTTPYDCSYSETYQDGTEIKILNQWKPTKALLTKEDALFKSNYGLILIPKFDSKPKYDDFGSVETTAGTKYFKVEWETPLITNAYGWGSAGKIGFFDDLTGIEYHPYWNLSYPYRSPMNATDGYPYVANATGGVSGQFIHYLAGNSTYLYSTGAGVTGDKAVATNTTEVPHFVVNSSGIFGYDIGSVYNAHLVTTFDENSGSMANDSSGYANNGTCKGVGDGNCNWTDGVFGSGIKLDGVNDYVTWGDPGDGSLDFGTNDFAVEFDLYLRSSENLEPIFCRGYDFSPQEGGGGFIFYNDGGPLVVRLADGDNLETVTVMASADDLLNSWRHFVFNFDRDGNLAVYIDGVINGTGSIAAASGSINDTYGFYVGITPRYGTTYIGHFDMDELRLYERRLTETEITERYQNILDNRSLLETEETAPKVTVNTSIYAAALNISDFTFSATEYIEVATINFTTTVTKNLTFLSSFNLKKLTGALSNNIRVNITIDGTQILEERVRTLTTNVDEGATGTSPVPFSLSIGTHNLTFYIRKETGNGAIEINDINAIIIQFLSTQDYNITEGLTTIDKTFSSTSLTEIAQIPLTKITNSSRFLTSKFDIKADATTIVVCRSECLHTGEVSDYVIRYLEDSDDTGTIFLTFLDPIETPSHNFTLKCLSTTGATVTINGSVISSVMKDQNNNTIQNQVSGNISTNYSSTLTLTAGTHKLANSTSYLQNGTGLLISGISSFGSNSGAQTPYLFINVSGVSESQCYTKLERYLSGNLDVGNLGIFYLCDGLTVGFNYSVNLWLNVPAGEEVILYDETLSHFEISTFDILVANTPPIVAILEPAADQVMDQDGLINWTITDTLGDRYEINITLWNSTNTSQVAFLPDTEESYTFNFSSLADGIYNLTIESCENETVDLFCSNFTIQITISTNLPPTASLNSPDDNGTNISIPPTLNVTVTDPNANAMNITFYNQSDSILCANLSIVSGLDVYCLWPDLSTNTTYFWYVIVTDGTFPVTSDTWNFTTSAVTTTTTTTTTIATTTTTLVQNLTGLMQVILDDRTMSEHKICIYQLIGWEDNDTQESGIRPNLILCFNSPNTYLSQHSNSELLKITIAEDCDYIIKVQKQREDFLASPSNFLNGLLQNLGYLIMALIVVLSCFALWKKLS